MLGVGCLVPGVRVTDVGIADGATTANDPTPGT
jgi:hypothetical protein